MTSSKEKTEAARLLAIRKRAKRSILDYARAIDIPGKALSENADEEFFQPIETSMAAHHRLLLSELDRISRIPQGRLMVFMPPGSAKSTFASVVFPTFFLGTNPGSKIILASYGDDLAKKLGRRCRSILRQKRYEGIMRTRLRSDTQAVQDFALENGSEYMSCGILSSVTGNRANGLIIDDPVKGREQADSQTYRDKIWEAYQDDLKTRLVPGGWICLVQTRWHEDDLAGRILPGEWNGESGEILCRDGTVWTVICLPAKCEREDDPIGRKVGDYLWPEWFTPEHWKQFESYPRTWSALFQQRPSPLEGGLFKVDKILVVDDIPYGSRFVRAWDLASTEGGGDWTAGGLIGETRDGRILIADMVRGQWDAFGVESRLIETANLDGRRTPIFLPQDPGQAGKAQIVYLVGKLKGYTVRTATMSGDKVTRAEPFSSQVNAGNVVMLRGGWNYALREELRTFPGGAHDDQVDAQSSGFNDLTEHKTDIGTWEKLGKL
ncbi:MAG: phage terminase large subunit [Nitrospirota bacterium]|nr:phage terminase large subunit [Nitrospirota bacterium]